MAIQPEMALGKYTRERLAARLSSSDGTNPVNGLLYKVKYLRPARFPSAGGMDPVN